MLSKISTSNYSTLNNINTKSNNIKNNTNDININKNNEKIISITTESNKNNNNNINNNKNKTKKTTENNIEENSEISSFDIYTYFQIYNEIFFENLLGAVTLKWSKKMTSCAGVFSIYKNIPSIHLSEPLLKFRSITEIKETLLHEMIHAYCHFKSYDMSDDLSGHGKHFKIKMKEINKITGFNITVYHNFIDEVEYYTKYVWRCNGKCRNEPPFFGYVKRQVNRPPQKADKWWDEHEKKCGGTFERIKPTDEEIEKEKNMKKKKNKKIKNNNINKNLIEKYFDDNNNNKNKNDKINNVLKEKNLNNNNDKNIDNNINNVKDNKNIHTIKDYENNNKIKQKNNNNNNNKENSKKIRKNENIKISNIFTLGDFI